MNKLVLLLSLLVILFGIYNSRFSTAKSAGDHPKKSGTRHIVAKSLQSSHFEEELSRIDTPDYAKRYIISVIDHGSSDLGFVGGVMEGGYVAREDAPKIACYVLSLSGKKCREPYPADAEMFFTSICGGCHGNDGKGVGGSYPDLTREKLLGIERREAFLREKIMQSKKE